MATGTASRNALPAGDARQRITATIGEIQDRMSPSRILAEGLERVAASSGQFAAGARDAARAHPLALGAAAIAVGVALFTRRRLSKARVDLGDDMGDYTDYDDGFGFAAPVDDDAAPVARARQPVAAPGKAEAEPGNPVVSILIGLLAGAALGAIFPATDAERRVLGDAGSRLGDAARAAARRATDELSAATRR
jgi:hypothetical protein